jgi:hypothetical protein
MKEQRNELVMEALEDENVQMFCLSASLKFW